MGEKRLRLKRIVLPGLMLLALFAVAFLIRATANSLPVAEPREQSFFQDENGIPYLPEIDSYYYLRKAREMAETGEIRWTSDRNQDPMIGQKGYDLERGIVMPLGLSAAAALLWRFFLSAFGVSLTKTAFWMGPVFGAAAAVPAFLYVLKRTNLWGGCAAGILAGCALPFVLHTLKGWFDTDMMLSILPMTAVLAQIRFLAASSGKRRWAFGVLSAAALAAMALCWRGWLGYWIFVVLCVLISSLLLGGSPAASPGIPVRKRWTQAGGGLLASLALCTVTLLLARGGDVIRDVPDGVETVRMAMGNMDSMPYLFRYTSEMQPVPFFPKSSGLTLVKDLMKSGTASVLNRMGGLAVFVLAVSYLPLRVYRVFRGRSESVETAEERALFIPEAVFLGLWAAGGVTLACLGKRFAEIAVMPVGLLCALQIGQLFQIAGKTEGRRRVLAYMLCAGAAAACVFPAVWGAWKSTRAGSWPPINGSKQAAMQFIRENTTEETAVASWWDHGYYMEYEAERRTLMDGGSDSGKKDWFMAKALLTEDPKLTCGILRMMNESGTDALDDLVSQGMNQARAAAYLLRILPLDRHEAEELCQEEGIPFSVLNRTHPENPGSVVLTLSTDLIGKTLALGYYAYWDPETKAQEEKTFVYHSSASVLAEGEKIVIPMRNTDYTLTLRRNEAGGFTAEYTEQGKTIPPSRLCVWEDGKRVQDLREENDHLAAVVVREGERCSALLCSGNLCDSMLVRLLFCEEKSAEMPERLGTWYADTEKEACAAQRRIGYEERAAWVTQIWRISDDRQP